MCASGKGVQAEGFGAPALAVCGPSGSGRNALQAWRQRPLYAGLLVGGKSTRMGQPKQLEPFQGSTLGEIAARALSDGMEAECGLDGLTLWSANLLLLGSGTVPTALAALPRLDDAPGVGGPLAGVLAARRWAPRAAWVVAACDHPWLRAEEIRALVGQRRPGVWAILAQQGDQRPCPTLALYEPQALSLLERALHAGRSDVRLAELIDHPRTVVHSLDTRGAVNVNTPEELAAAEKQALEEGKI
jgi:molybdopterin-guanine dinucleotide biosynthesis protein A